MNCLSSCNGGYEFNLTETNDPLEYPPQLPYNPDFTEEHVEREAVNFDPGNVWSTYYGEFYVRNTFENYDVGGRARCSLYEGVNCTVSAPACVHRAARRLL